MTITNVIELDGTPFQANDVWYSPRIADSSFVESVAIRNNSDGSADIKYVLAGDREYVYNSDQDFGQAVWDDLSEGASPGTIYANVREYTSRYPFVPKIAPEANWTISVTGPASQVDLLIQHLQAAGFSVE